MYIQKKHCISNRSTLETSPLYLPATVSVQYISSHKKRIDLCPPIKKHRFISSLNIYIYIYIYIYIQIDKKHCLYIDLHTKRWLFYLSKQEIPLSVAFLSIYIRNIACKYIYKGHVATISTYTRKIPFISSQQTGTGLHTVVHCTCSGHFVLRPLHTRI